MLKTTKVETISQIRLEVVVEWSQELDLCDVNKLLGRLMEDSTLEQMGYLYDGHMPTSKGAIVTLACTYYAVDRPSRKALETYLQQTLDKHIAEMFPERTLAGYEKLVKLVEAAATKVLGQPPETGGCRPFYSPDDWRARGEEYGHNSELIICHDGGDYAHLCNMDYESYTLLDRFREELEKHGYYTEQCTCWYSAVYKK